MIICSTHLQLASILLVLKIPTHSSIRTYTSLKSVLPNSSGPKNYSSAASLFRDPDQNETFCDGYTLFMEDVGFAVAGLDLTIYVTDFLPLAVDNFIAVWDFFTFYVLGVAFNYVDFNAISGFGPSPGPILSIIITLASLMTVFMDLFFFRPISSLTYLWAYASASFGNLSLAIALFTQFEEEILKIVGIREKLQDYLKDYNDCYTLALQRMQAEALANSTMLANSTTSTVEPTMLSNSSQVISTSSQSRFMHFIRNETAEWAAF